MNHRRTSYSTTRVRVVAPARLHLGFLDMNGNLGRRFGSIGLTIGGLDTVVTAVAAPGGGISVTGDEAVRARAVASRTLAFLHNDAGLELTVSQVAPAHHGLGSGTQLSLAIATAIAHALGQPQSVRALATAVGRGARSGVGIAGFEVGGLLVDGGRSPQGAIAPLLARFDFPAEWRVILVFDAQTEGLHGADERAAFAALAPMPAADVGDLARWCLMGLLPALAEQDFASFSRAVAAIQTKIGGYFAPCQGGQAFTSPRVAQAVRTLARRCELIGIGQSSWGPTGFILAPSASTAADVLALAAREDWPGVCLQIVTGRNHGAIIETSPP